MYFIFDTETSNLPVASYPLTHPNQCRVLSIGCLLLDDKFQEQASFYSLINVPEDLIISEGAFKANGLTVEQCNTFGIDIEDALSVFSSLWLKSLYKCGHNIEFDLARIQDEMEIICGKRPNLPLESELICTKKIMTPICNIFNSAYPNKSPKWPNLNEAFLHVTGNNMTNAHNALVDCRAVAQIIEWLHTHHPSTFNIKEVET